MQVLNNALIYYSALKEPHNVNRERMIQNGTKPRSFVWLSSQAGSPASQVQRRKAYKTLAWQRILPSHHVLHVHGGDSLLVFNDYVVSMERVSHTSKGGGNSENPPSCVTAVTSWCNVTSTWWTNGHKPPSEAPSPLTSLSPTFFVLRVLNKGWGEQTFGNGCHYPGELSWQWVNTQTSELKCWEWT